MEIQNSIKPQDSRYRGPDWTEIASAVSEEGPASVALQRLRERIAGRSSISTTSSTDSAWRSSRICSLKIAGCPLSRVFHGSSAPRSDQQRDTGMDAERYVQADWNTDTVAEMPRDRERIATSEVAGRLIKCRIAILSWVKRVGTCRLSGWEMYLPMRQDGSYAGYEACGANRASARCPGGRYSNGAYGQSINLSTPIVLLRHSRRTHTRHSPSTGICRRRAA